MLILYDGDEDVVDDNDDIDDDGSVRKQTRFHYFVDVAAAILDKQLSNERRLCSKTITDSPHRHHHHCHNDHPSLFWMIVAFVQPVINDHHHHPDITKFKIV